MAKAKMYGMVKPMPNSKERRKNPFKKKGKKK